MQNYYSLSIFRWFYVWSYSDLALNSTWIQSWVYLENKTMPSKKTFEREITFRTGYWLLDQKEYLTWLGFRTAEWSEKVVFRISSAPLANVLSRHNKTTCSVNMCHEIYGSAIWWCGPKLCWFCKTNPHCDNPESREWGIDTQMSSHWSPTLQPFSVVSVVLKPVRMRGKCSHPVVFWFCVIVGLKKTPWTEVSGPKGFDSLVLG